jgi:hypothetical protein
MEHPVNVDQGHCNTEINVSVCRNSLFHLPRWEATARSYVTKFASIHCTGLTMGYRLQTDIKYTVLKRTKTHSIKYCAPPDYSPA